MADKSNGINIQPFDLVKFIKESEPDLFSNSSDNLMPVIYQELTLKEWKELSNPKISPE